MQVVIAPDKFKGSLTSAQVCNAITEGILKSATGKPDILHFPMADGGDGFNSVLQHYFQTRTVNAITVDPLGRTIETPFRLNKKERLAIVEMAAASGLVLLKDDERNPMNTSTLGTGTVIADAYRLGARKIVLGLGGSATNDAGIGILAALGFVFLNETGEELEPIGGNLLNIHTVKPPLQLMDISFVIAADVENPLFGPKGAAYVYGPQKGADQQAVEALDQGLRHFASVISRQFSKDISSFPGSGAAGGIAAGLSAFFDVEMKKGVELVLQFNQLEEKLKHADLIITGEGKIDDQSGSGKVVGTIASLASKYNKPCIAFCGLLDADENEISALQLTAAYTIADQSKSSEENMKNGYTLLRDKAEKVFPLYQQ